MIPNLVEVVKETKEKYPRAWSKCHKAGDPEAWDFAILAIRKMHDINPLFGLNGKRGSSNPNDMSWDATNWKGNGVDPANVIDFVAGAGGDNPQPAWGVTNTTGHWWNPYQFNTHYKYEESGGGGGEEPEPKPTECKFAKTDLTEVNAKLDALMNNQVNVEDLYKKLEVLAKVMDEINQKLDRELEATVNNRYLVLRGPVKWVEKKD